MSAGTHPAGPLFNSLGGIRRCLVRRPWNSFRKPRSQLSLRPARHSRGGFRKPCSLTAMPSSPLKPTRGLADGGCVLAGIAASCSRTSTPASVSPFPPAGRHRSARSCVSDAVACCWPPLADHQTDCGERGDTSRQSRTVARRFSQPPIVARSGRFLARGCTGRPEPPRMPGGRSPRRASRRGST